MFLKIRMNDSVREKCMFTLQMKKVLVADSETELCACVAEPYTVGFSQSSLIHLIGPSDCTLHGFVHGGKELYSTAPSAQHLLDVL